MLPFTCWVYFFCFFLRVCPVVVHCSDLITPERDGKQWQTPSSSWIQWHLVMRVSSMRAICSFIEDYLCKEKEKSTFRALAGKVNCSVGFVPKWGATSVFDVLSQIVLSVRILHRQEWVKWRSRAAIALFATSSEREEREREKKTPTVKAVLHVTRYLWHPESALHIV